MILMNEYIQLLKDQGKLNLSIDKSKKFYDIKKPFVIAGPCSVESRSMILYCAEKLKEIGVDALRGGAYKPCTYPITKSINGWKEGLREEGIRYLRDAKQTTGLPIVSEIMDADQLNGLSLNAIDIIQVGTRNFQNYTLLDKLGKLKTPILLKRGTWGTLDEILGACERILVGGNSNVMICLRGVVGMPSYRHIFPSTRWAPDLMMIPALKEFTNIPIIYDPSHSTGYRNFVPAISKAALAAGADGLVIECHPNPDKSISDPDQAITFETMEKIMEEINV